MPWRLYTVYDDPRFISEWPHAHDKKQGRRDVCLLEVREVVTHVVRYGLVTRRDHQFITSHLAYVTVINNIQTCSPLERPFTCQHTARAT